MAKSKPKKSQTRGLTPYWGPSWNDMEKSIENFKKDMEKSFTSFPSFKIPSISMPHMPKFPDTSCDVIDEGNQLRVKMDVPGVKKNDIDLNVTDNSIEITAGHKESKEEKKKNFLRKERSEVSYYRTLPLPEKVHSSKAKAKLTDGVLDVVIPKITPTAKPKKQSIRVQ
jgi:HSP20 family protein